MNAAHRGQLAGRPAISQTQSPLYGKLPGEVRDLIFALALADYPDPDPDRQYAAETCYTRPSYRAPRRTDARLLRTCRAVYAECWHLPLALRERTYWVTAADRAPPAFNRPRLENWDEMASLHVFAQMYNIDGGRLAPLLAMPFLRVTLTIRHTDWWFWEDDMPLSFEGGWMQSLCRIMSNSVRELHIELESLERKKGQVDEIARQMAERWCFKRRDGVVLYASVDEGAVAVSRWSGASTWHSRRWIRDETAPGRIDYYVAKVSFRNENELESRGGTISEGARETARRGFADQARLKLALPEATPMQCLEPSVYVGTTELSLYSEEAIGLSQDDNDGVGRGSSGYDRETLEDLETHQILMEISGEW